MNIKRIFSLVMGNSMKRPESCWLCLMNMSGIGKHMRGGVVVEPALYAIFYITRLPWPTCCMLLELDFNEAALHLSWWYSKENQCHLLLYSGRMLCSDIHRGHLLMFFVEFHSSCNIQYINLKNYPLIQLKRASRYILTNIGTMKQEMLFD